MKRSITALFLLGLVGFAAPHAAAKRKVVPVPSWSAFDGVRWGDLVLGETTRAAFERDYSSSPTENTSVIEGNTPNHTRTVLFLAFDGSGPEARLAWIACSYGRGRGRPSPVELASHYDGSVGEGYPPGRRADWRLRVATERGAAALLERGPKEETVAALIFARPEALAAAARRLSPRETAIASPLAPADLEPLEIRIGDVDVDVDVDSGISLDEHRLQRALQSAAEGTVRLQSALEMDATGRGRIAVDVRVRPRRKGNEQKIRVEARATLAGEGPYGLVSARSSEYSRELAGTSSASRITREVHEILEQAINDASADALSQLLGRRDVSLKAAERKARLDLVAFLAGLER